MFERDYQLMTTGCICLAVYRKLQVLKWPGCVSLFSQPRLTIGADRLVRLSVRQRLKLTIKMTKRDIEESVNHDRDSFSFV